MVLKAFPNVITLGQQYDFGEKPTVRLYTDINHHVGTPKQNIKKHYLVSSMNLEKQSTWTKSSILQ